MSWSAARIEKEILLTGLECLAISPYEIVSAFERVERVLGHEWLTARISARGIAATTEVVGMGLSLAALDSVPSAEAFIKLLRHQDQNSIAELTAIYILLQIDGLTPSVELHPEVGRRKADFRIRREEGPWTYVEVTQPTASFVEKRVREVLYTLANGVRAVECQFVLHVCLLREPTKNEVSLLCARLPEFCRLPAPRQAKLIDGMGYLYLSQTDIGKLHFPEVPELVGKPKIGLAMLTAGGPQGAPHHQVSVAIPFTDERGEEILRRESKQLPPKGPGLIMININGSDGNFDAWSSLILPRFKANIHTRVSGVILFSAGWRQTVHGYQFRPETKLLSNPHAKHQLSEWVHRVISQ